MGAYFGMIELGRAGKMTRQTSSRKGCSKMSEHIWKKQKISPMEGKYENVDDDGMCLDTQQSTSDLENYVTIN